MSRRDSFGDSYHRSQSTARFNSLSSNRVEDSFITRPRTNSVSRPYLRENNDGGEAVIRKGGDTRPKTEVIIEEFLFHLSIGFQGNQENQEIQEDVVNPC